MSLFVLKMVLFLFQCAANFKQAKCNQGRPRMSTAGRLLAHPVIDRFFITPYLIEARLLSS